MMGDRVMATKPDMTTAMAKVKANSRNNTPERPDRNPIGAYTTASVIVMAMMGESSRREEASAASFLDMPSRRFRATFSTTTMASSTTIPMASTKPNNDSALSEKPSICIKAKVPTSDTGTATSGIIDARQVCRNSTTTNTTSSTASSRVFTTASIEPRTNTVGSYTMS